VRRLFVVILGPPLVVLLFLKIVILGLIGPRLNVVADVISELLPLIGPHVCFMGGIGIGLGHTLALRWRW
jgi:hypothetical protein